MPCAEGLPPIQSAEDDDEPGAEWPVLLSASLHLISVMLRLQYERGLAHLPPTHALPPSRVN